LYRHGPVSMYDLKGLGVQELRNGWYGETPTVSLVTQLAVGLLGGLLVGLTLHSRLRPRLGALARQWYEDAGPALTLAIVLAGATLLSITLLLLHIWLTPMAFAVGIAVVLLTNLRPAVALMRTGLARVRWRQVATGTLLAIPIAGVLAVAVANAAQRDTFRVQEILDDPSTVQMSPHERGPMK